MKRLIAFALVCMLILVPVSAFAENSIDTQTAVLTDENGNAQVVTGYLVNCQPYSLAEDNAVIAKTYAFPVELRGSGSLSEDDTDGSISVTVYSTIYYSTGVEPKSGETTYLLTKVAGNWEILDPSVRVTSASVFYGSNGMVPEVVTNQRATKTVNNNFSFSTNFTKYVLDYEATIGMRTTVNLKQVKGTSTRTWSFTASNNLYP